jgi:hypothetical protein
MCGVGAGEDDDEVDMDAFEQQMAQMCEAEISAARRKRLNP